MPIKVVLGAQWGKLVDILAPEAQLCFHLLPSGLINPNCMNFIGSDVPSFFSELKQLEEKGLPNVYDRILVSDRVHINFDLHAAVDGLEEIELGANITVNGPSYSRSGIRLADVFDQELFESKLRRLAHGYKARYGDLLKYDVEEEIERFRGYRAELAKYAVDGLSFMYSASAVMLDLSMGSYPYVTSSNTAISGIIAGLTLNPKNITETIGVVKALDADDLDTTRVGAGAFKTEDLEEYCYPITTQLWNRSRLTRCATGLEQNSKRWAENGERPQAENVAVADLVVVKHGHMVNYYTALNLTKLDVLDSFETIKIAIAYKDKRTGQELDYYPADHNILDDAEVVYHEMPGWNKPTTNARTYDELPKQAQDYIEYIEKFIGVKQTSIEQDGRMRKLATFKNLQSPPTAESQPQQSIISPGIYERIFAMSGPINIGSDGEWQSLLSGTTVVVADFYADWCGPCKMIAPHFERLAKEHSRPNKVAFAKVNVDNQANIARTNGVTAMPTFKIFHNGTAVETIRGANPSALTEAITKAVSLSDGGKVEDVFKTPGRTLGGDGPIPGQGRHWSVTLLLNIVMMSQSLEDIEKVVREAKQRFRDTLPKGYLNDEEYALYERLYGPPLRETAPEDVGIPTHADMGGQSLRVNDERTLLRQLEEGGFEEVTYELPHQQSDVVEASLDSEQPLASDSALEAIQESPGYVDAVARNPREHEALQRLMQDFKAAQQKQIEDEIAAAREEAEAEQEAYEMDEEDELFEEPDQTTDSPGRDMSLGETRRFHPFTLQGRFHGSPVEIALPQSALVTPIRDLLDRTHLNHVKTAAEAAFGGQGLPTSPHMTEIEADAFLAGFLPPAYASATSVLREVRKRLGSDWIQERLKRTENAGLSVLDAGAGGAGLVAWEQVLNTEWNLLREKGEVTGSQPPGRKTVITGSDRLRHRLKGFLHNTTFLPRLPDYEHSGEMQGEHLDAGSKLQPRKSYDLIIASHLFLKEKQDHYRQAILNNLWTLLNKDGGVLIVIEKAHPRGFEAVAHVRDTLLKQFLLPQNGEPSILTEELNPAFHKEREAGHIIAPCTNHGTCPMYKEAGKSKGRKDYCYFNQRFTRPTFYTKMLGNSSNNQGDVEFSYVAIQRGRSKKGQLPGWKATEQAFAGYENSSDSPDMQALPRMVLPPLKRKGHVTLDVCTPEGKIERWTVPKSFSKLAYHDARKSHWGDLWALGAKTKVPRSVRVGSGVDDGGKRAEGGKKPRKVEITMDGGRLSANEKNARKERRTKGKRAKQTDLIKEILEMEDLEEQEIEREMDAEVEEELRVDEEDRRRKR
ncbi:P-loop containing nucleoside triphosphate hydrolase protein [Trichoderma pleuroticola]